MQPREVQQFCDHLRLRNYAPHTIESYALDLRLFFDQVEKQPQQTTWRDIDRFIQQQHQHGLAATTINRRLHAIKRFFDFLVEYERLTINPVKPSQYLREGRPLPKRLTQEQIKRLFAQIKHPMDHALFLLMLRCGLRVSEVARLKVSDIDWEQPALLVEQGKGRKDRWVYLSPDVVRRLQDCGPHRPASGPSDYFFWNQKRKAQPLSVKAIQKKMERYAKAAGLTASCHWLRHTFASNLLEEGAEIVSIKAFLGHESIRSRQRYARLSDRKIKQSYLHAIKKVIQKTKV